MAGLSLNLFTSAGTDLESAQYRVLGQLHQVRQAFANNEIYPHLGQLINLYGSLQSLHRQFTKLKDAFPGTITGIDLEAQRVVKEQMPIGHPEVAFLEELVQWALGPMQEAIEEGRTIFEFVEEHLYLEEVGIVPSYMEEGYLMLPALRDGVAHIFRYKLSIFTDASERYRTLKTTHVKTIPWPSTRLSPRQVKLRLMEEYQALPNPATYFCETDLDFPFESTVLPIAKRKLMRYLFSQGGTA